MRLSRTIPLFSLLFAAFAGASDASACAGFFQTNVTPITGHRMILSVSQQSTTLWDQFDYTGDPASFGWVFPIKGAVEVGVSSDGLFQAIEQSTTVTIEGLTPSCSNGGVGGGDGAPGGGRGVDILAQGVVGPFEQVQLTAQDPKELTDWLSSHGYTIPASVEPIIAEYVNEGFGFLAMRLVPGMGVDAIKPVRVTFPGAAPTIPLRLLKAGTSGDVPVNLWVFAEGRWEPSNFPTFTIESKDLVWNWDTDSSNYEDLRAAGFAAGEGKAWLVSSAHLFEPSQIAGILQDQALQQYADEQGMNAQAVLDADMAALYGSLAASDVWVNHFVGVMSQDALSADMQLQAASDQTPVSSYLVPAATAGKDPCGDGGSGGSGDGGSGGSSDGGCSVRTPDDANGAGLLVALGAAIGIFRSRRRRGQDTARAT